MPRNRSNPVHVDGMAEGVHRDNGGYPAAGFAIDGAAGAPLRNGVEARAERLRIHPKGFE